MRERGTGSLRLRNGIWWARYYHHGDRIEVSCETDNEKKAGRFLRKKLAEVSEGTHADSRNLRYEDLRDAYMQDYAINERKSLRRDKDGKPRLDAVKRLDDFFVGWRAVEIDADQIRKFQADQQARALSNGSINRSVSALRRMFHLAVEEGKLRTVPHFPMLREAPARKGFFERDSYAKLSRELPDYLRLPLALGFFTGMRLGEIERLEWEQIDFIGNTIMLRAGETKNDEARSIPIVPQLRALLVQQHAHRKPGCPYVCFRLDRRGQAVKLGGFHKAWQSACVRAELGKWEPTVELVTRSDRPHGKAKVKRVYCGMIFHDLRRSAVRNLVRSQVPEIVARQITGHKTRSVFDRYNIVSVQDLDDASRKLAKYLKNGDKTGTVLHQDAADDLVCN